jgi:hypothetical protein
MKKWSALFAAIVLTNSSMVSAAFSDSASGTTTAEFLNLGVGGRAAAMGEAYSALANEATALYWNPAALTQVPSKSVTFMHAAYLDSSRFDYAAYAQNFGKVGSLGVGVQYFSAGDITQTDSSGADVGSFNPNDRAISLGYGIQVVGFGLGATVKQISSKLTQSDTTLSADIGVLSPAYLENRLRLAFTGRNLMGSLKYRSESEDLPTEYRLGSGYKFNDRWIGGLDLAFPKNADPYQAIGTEYVWGSKDSFTLGGRLGYSTRSKDVDGFSGFSFGAGFGLKSVSLDYAIVPFGDVGTAHRFSMSLDF